MVERLGIICFKGEVFILAERFPRRKITGIENQHQELSSWNWLMSLVLIQEYSCMNFDCSFVILQGDFPLYLTS